MKGSRFGYLIVSDSDEDSDDVKAVDRRELLSGGAPVPRVDPQTKNSITPDAHLSAPGKEHGLDTAQLTRNLGNNHGDFVNKTAHASNPSPMESRSNRYVLNSTERGQVGEATDALTSAVGRVDDHFPLVASEHVCEDPVPQRIPSSVLTKNDSPRDLPRAGNVESGVQIENQANLSGQTVKGDESRDHAGSLGIFNYTEGKRFNLFRTPIALPPEKLSKRAQQAAFKHSIPPDSFDKEMLIAPEIPLPIKSQVPRAWQNLDALDIPSIASRAINGSSGPSMQNPPQFSSPSPIGNLTEDAIAERREIFSSQRRPVIPSPSVLKTESSHYDLDDEGNMVLIVPECVRRVVNSDGDTSWVIISKHLENASPSMRKVGSPPSRLSRRAEKIMGLRDDVKAEAPEDIVEETAPDDDHEVSIPEDGIEVKAAEDIIEEDAPEDFHEVSVPMEAICGKSPTSGPPRRQTFIFPSEYYFSNICFQKHIESTMTTNKSWSKHPYDHQVLCRCAWGALMTDNTHRETEKMVRILQPIQTGPLADVGNGCECIIYANKGNDKVTELLCSPEGVKEAFGRYLNMQPMQLDNTKLVKVANVLAGSPYYLQYRSLLSRPVDGVRMTNTLGDTVRLVGELPCTVEPLRENDLSGGAAKSLSARVMRVCGGLISGLPLRDNDGSVLDVRRYELFLFLPDSACPTAYSCGPGCPTLGQLTSPPISSFPLTPRIISDPMELSACKESLRVLNIFENIPHWEQGDWVSLDAVSDGIAKGMQFLTLTLATLNTRKKYTIDLTLIILPYRTCCKSGDDKVLAELPPVSPDSILKGFRMRAISLSFSTKSAFMSAYMSLLWATECNVNLTRPSERDCDRSNKGTTLPLRVSATTSPLIPWSSSFQKVDPSVESSGIYRGHCMNFAAVALTTSLGDEQPDVLKGCDVLKLDDLFIEKYTSGEDPTKGRKVNDSRWGAGALSETFTFDTNSVFLQRHCRAFMESRCFGGTEGDEQDAIVGYTPFGIVYRALNQKTQEMFDVQVVPRRYVYMGLGSEATSYVDATGQVDESNLQDTVAILLLKYTSRLPFQPRIYDIYSDNECYYILQEPWLSILAVEQSIKGAEHRKIIECHALLKQAHYHTSVISLKDFIHAILNPLHSSGRQALDAMEARLQIVRLLIVQLLLLIAALHGKGILLGPCSTHRVLVQINAPTFDAMKRGDSCPDDNSSPGTFSSSRRCITSKSLSLFVPGIGVHTAAWTYERQQCGVLEYVPPMYVFEAMASDEIGMEGRAWTMQDDWWSLLSISFELLASDGSTLVCPGMKGAESLPLAPTSLNSKFVSSDHILDLWKGVLTNQEISAHPTSEAISARIRNYVQCRVLESVAPGLDSWLACKVEETKHVKAADMGPNETGSRIGAVLASGGVGESIDTSDETLLNPEETKIENAATCLPLIDVVSGIPWIIFYRDWFDTVMDIALPSLSNSKCVVHGPLLYLLSHPFLGAMDVGAVFDGNYRLPHAAEEFFHKHMSKAKLRQALFLYRTHSHRPSITNCRNGIHAQPRPEDGIDTSSLPTTLRPPSLQRSTDRKVSADNMTNSSSPSELLSSRVQLSQRVRRSLLQSLYASDEITSIDWLEREVDSALHPRADKKTADAPPHNGRALTSSGVQYDPKESGAFSSNSNSTSKPLKQSNTTLSQTECMQHLSGAQRNGYTGRTYSTTTRPSNYKQNGNTLLDGVAMNSCHSLCKTPKGKELSTNPLKTETVKAHGLAAQPYKEPQRVRQPEKLFSSQEDTANQNVQRVPPESYTLRANGWNVDPFKARSKSNAYFPDRATGSAATYSTSQQNTEWKVSDYRMPLNSTPMTSVSKTERIAGSLKGHSLKNESQDDGFTVLVPSDSDDMSENTPVLYNKGPHCHHYTSEFNRRYSR
ncbi:unnamed protein product [Phytomonas sp. EM1]|nr:unnamed protein product [Phytomonas sp. EM1]|eukprot:CCW62694.1 unnamed protein product [Phytomonas sp. isolate EM1]